MAVAIAAAVYFLLPASCPEAARRTAFIFTLAALLWALEIVPLYATSMVVVLLEIFLLCRPDGVLGMDRSGYKVFLVPFASPIIILFFGGFVLAAAVSKYNLDRVIARRLLGFLGHNPLWIMLGIMGTTGFLSMWMSNTASTAMMIAMMRPLLQQLDSDDRYRVGLALSIAFAANIGGIGTPVGTPPNAIALGLLQDQGIYLSFLSWMLMAVPLAIIMLFVAAFILIKMYPSKHKRVTFDVTSGPGPSRGAKRVAFIAIFTVILWLTSGLHKIPESVVALLAAGIYAATRLLSKDDFKNIDWDILLLMWGGLALGTGMEISGLTSWIVSLPILDQHGFWLVVMACVLAVLLSTFMSNTATANLLIPIVIAIPGENPVLLAITLALCCSSAMALPVSTPPNAIAFASQVVTGRDMLRAGALVSLVSVVIILAGFQFVIPLIFGQ